MRAAPVAAFTLSTVVSAAISRSARPAAVMSITAISVTIILTTFKPVTGSVQRDVDAGRHVIGHERRHADAQVHIVAVLQLARNAFDDAIANVSHSAPCVSLSVSRTACPG